MVSVARLPVGAQYGEGVKAARIVRVPSSEHAGGTRVWPWGRCMVSMPSLHGRRRGCQVVSAQEHKILAVGVTGWRGHLGQGVIPRVWTLGHIG